MVQLVCWRRALIFHTIRSIGLIVNISHIKKIYPTVIGPGCRIVLWVWLGTIRLRSSGMFTSDHVLQSKCCMHLVSSSAHSSAGKPLAPAPCCSLSVQSLFRSRHSRVSNVYSIIIDSSLEFVISGCRIFTGIQQAGEVFLPQTQYVINTRYA